VGAGVSGWGQCRRLLPRSCNALNYHLLIMELSPSSDDAGSECSLTLAAPAIAAAAWHSPGCWVALVVLALLHGSLPGVTGWLCSKLRLSADCRAAVSCRPGHGSDHSVGQQARWHAHCSAQDIFTGP
jgi:hypothetical protein